jgi:hypothetical protein
MTLSSSGKGVSSVPGEAPACCAIAAVRGRLGSSLLAQRYLTIVKRSVWGFERCPAADAVISSV